MMKPIFSFWCLLMMIIMQAQNCNLDVVGKVLDFHTGEPIANAEIKILPSNQMIKSNSNGFFEIKDLCSNTYQIEVNHPDCDTEFYELNPTQEKDITVFLEHHIIELEKVEVKGLQHQEINSMGEQHIHNIEIQKNSSDAFGLVLKNISGVEGMSSGNNIVKPIIHGMHSSRILMLNNGIKQEDMEWGVEHAPNMDVNNFADIKVMKGGAALRYGGDAIGGVILAEYDHLPKIDTLKGFVSLTGQSNGRGGTGTFRLQKGFKKNIAFQIQGTYKRLGDYETPNYILSNTASEQKSAMAEFKWGNFERNINASYSYFEQDLGILKATHVGNLRDLYYAMNAEKPTPINDFGYTINKPFQNIVHHLAKLKFENRWKSFGKLETTYAFQFNNRKEYDVRIGENKNIPAMNTRLITHSGDVVLTIDKYADFEWIGGISALYQNNYSNPETNVKRLIPDYDKYNWGAFVSSNYDISPQIKIDGGIRYDFNYIDTKKYYDKDYWNIMNYNQDFSHLILKKFNNEYLTHFKLKFHTMSASLGALYKPTNTTQFRLNYALNKRAPNPSELFSEGLHHSAVSVELGDVRIKPETSHKISLELNKELNVLDGFNLNILGYYNAIQDYIYQIPTGVKYSIRGEFPIWSYKQTNVKLYGFDLDTDLKFNPNLHWQNQLSFIYGNDTKNDLPLISMPPLHWVQSISYQINSDWSPTFKIRTDYTAQQNRFPDYNFDVTFIENGQYVTKELDLSSTPKSYFLVGLDTGINIPNTLAKTQVNLKVNNLLNQEYRDYLNRFRYYADEIGRQIQLQIIINF